MAAMVTERPATPASASPPSHPSGGRFARWFASWRVSLKMARRDALRYKGRSALVVLMVALPVALIVGGLTLSATGSQSLRERLPSRLGNAVASIDSLQTNAVQQDVDGMNGYWSGDGDAAPPVAKPIPGMERETSSPEQIADALGGLLKGTVKTVQSGEFRWHDGIRRPWGSAVFLDPTWDFGPLATLASGRWPTSNAEVVVTPLGIHQGMPETGVLTLTAGGQERTVTIVGVAQVRSEWNGMPALATTNPWSEQALTNTSYLLYRDAPVPWSEVRRLNEYGLGVTSREVVLNPPAPSELPGGWQQEASDRAALRVAAALLGSTLFVLTALLVGPAFAVSAGRQRRSLALAASNGAQTRQLRRSVLASAVVLGVFSVVVGAAIGAVTALAATTMWRQLRPWSGLFGPGEVPWLGVLIVAGCAILAALFAALIPALKLGRLDIVGVMKGQNVSPPASRTLPVVGLVIFALGIAGAFGAVLQESTVLAIVGVVGLFVGPLLLIPILLVACGRLASRLSAPARMATRDAARQRHRSAPTVAAVMAGTALLATFAVAMASDTKFQARLYTPQTLAGEATAWVGSANMPVFEALVASTNPTWQVVTEQGIGVDYSGPNPDASEPFLTLVPAGCSIAQTLPTFTASEPTEVNPCYVAGSMGGNTNRSSVTSLPAAEIIRRLELTGDQARAIREGAVLVGDPGWASKGEVTLAYGERAVLTGEQVASGASEAPVLWSKTTSYPALPIPADAYGTGGVNSYVGILVPQESVTAMKVSTTTQRVHLYDPAGPISTDAEERFNDRASEDMRITVERGFQRSDRLIMLIVFAIAGFLLTTVTLISTALALAEQQADMGTLAAVGATKATRRRFAGAQAATVALVGVCLGTLIGLVAGVAIAYPSTAHGWSEALQKEVILTPTVGIPVVHLLTIVIGVPLLAGLIAAASIRRAPHVTRRGN